MGWEVATFLWTDLVFAKVPIDGREFSRPDKTVLRMSSDKWAGFVMSL